MQLNDKELVAELRVMINCLLTKGTIIQAARDFKASNFKEIRAAQSFEC